GRISYRAKPAASCARVRLRVLDPGFDLSHVVSDSGRGRRQHVLTEPAGVAQGTIRGELQAQVDDVGLLLSRKSDRLADVPRRNRLHCVDVDEKELAVRPRLPAEEGHCLAVTGGRPDRGARARAGNPWVVGGSPDSSPARALVSTLINHPPCRG